MRELRIRKARKAAADLLRRHGAGHALPVPVEEIAKAEGARIESGGIEGALGLLVRTRRPWILTSGNHDHPGQYLFTVAHELGHLWLDHPGLEVCTRRSVVDGHRDHEAEANAFAAELLLPEQTVRRRCEASPVDLDLVRGIADESGASLVCAAIRFVELTSERCAVVLSQSGTVTWAVRSTLFWPTIQRGQRIHRESLAFEYERRGSVPDTCEPVDASAWVPGERIYEPCEIIEHATVLPQLDAVLSLVWIPDSCQALTFREI